MIHNVFKHLRKAPASAKAKLSYLGGTKFKTPAARDKAAADLLGVSQRTVREWRKGTRAPSKGSAAKLELAVEAKRERGSKRAARARIKEYTGGDGSAAVAVMSLHFSGPLYIEDSPGHRYGRPRTIVQPLTADQAQRYNTAWQADDDAQMSVLGREILAQYFNQGGGPHQVSPADLDYDDQDITWE